MKITFEVDNFFVLVQDYILKHQIPISRVIKALNRQDHDLLGFRRLRGWGTIVQKKNILIEFRFAKKFENLHFINKSEMKIIFWENEH